MDRVSFLKKLSDRVGSGNKNCSLSRLVEAAIKHEDALLTDNGSLSVKTGKYTGRSAKDKFIVCDDVSSSKIDWLSNRAMKPEHFANLLEDVLTLPSAGIKYQTSLYVSSDPRYELRVEVFTQYAWHAHFASLLLRRSGVKFKDQDADMVIVALPCFSADSGRHGSDGETLIACDFEKGIVIIVGTQYAGEIKKSAFSFLNYRLPDEGVMPMHCSVTEGRQTGDSVIFFGLSGTGKTTLSADSSRLLIGDDEHGWSENGLFNFEGGCYARVENLSAEKEPEIFQMVNRFGAILENVVVDPKTRKADFCDTSLTQNTRGAYPLDGFPNVKISGTTCHPSNIIFLTADAFGVLPPICRLDIGMAVFQFLSGYTAKIPGTERGIAEPVATFSTCFGAPFMSRPPSMYGDLLVEYIERYSPDIWLLNTGWIGGKYGEGQRISLPLTRRILDAILKNKLTKIDYAKEQVLGMDYPLSLPGIDTKMALNDGRVVDILDPKLAWHSGVQFDSYAKKLRGLFIDNAEKLSIDVPFTIS